MKLNCGQFLYELAESAESCEVHVIKLNGEELKFSKLIFGNLLTFPLLHSNLHHQHLLMSINNANTESVDGSTRNKWNVRSFHQKRPDTFR